MKKPMLTEMDPEWLAAELERTRQLLQKLEQTQQIRNSEQEEFAYVVSHDLKSQLASIVLTSEMLRENFGDSIDEGNDQLLNVLNRATTKIRNLADGILSYYRAERAMHAPPEPFLLKQAIQMVADMLRAGPTVEIHFPEQAGLIEANKSALEQIFSSLIQNAIRYGDKEKTVLDIRFREEGDFYYFEVQDNGPGIAAENQQKIFTLFTSLGDDRFGVPGLGIGLANVKKLVEKEGGEIRVRSIPGEGCVFEFSIQKRDAPAGK